MSFAVVRHPDIDNPGIVPDGALELQETRGWYRVSEWRDSPSDFHLPDFADAAAIEAAVPVSDPAEDTQDADDEAVWVGEDGPELDMSDQDPQHINPEPTEEI